MSILDSEQHSLLVLFACFIIAAVIIVPLKHGVNPGEGHIKDEEGYYAWAVLYSDGYYSLPLDKAEGEYHYHETVSIDPRVSDVVFYAEVRALDGDDKTDDLFVSLGWRNGTQISDAWVRIFLSEDRVLEEKTNIYGNAELHNIPFGPRPVEVFIPSEPPIVFHKTVEVQSNTARYGIYSETNITMLTNSTLENRTIRFLYENGTPAGGLALLKKGWPINYSNSDGEVILSGIEEKYGVFQVGKPVESDIIFYEPVSNIQAFLDGKTCGVTDENGAFFCSVIDKVQLHIMVRDTFKHPMEGVDVVLDKVKMGETDSDGELIFEAELDMKDHSLFFHKKVDGYQIPLASGLGMIDGGLHYINHWPPGPSMLLSWFMRLNIEKLFGLFLYVVLIASTYLLARRFFGYKWALLAALLVMTNSVVVMLFYAQWMGDLASATFCLLGLLLFVKGSERLIAGKRVPPMLLLFTSGLSFAAGVSMRYSSIVLCLPPVFYIIWSLYPRGGRLRGLFSATNIRRAVAVLAPWLIGLLVIGLLLAQYNTTYFGSPFNSGYQSTRTLFTVSETNGNQSLETYQPEESFFEAYFNYDTNTLLNLPRIFVFILCLIPVFFLCLPSILRWRRPLVTALFVWMAGILFIYLSQGWVLNHFFGDIRYYVAIVPAASILSVLILREIWHSSYWTGREGRRKLFILTVVSLLIVSSLLASADLLKNPYTGFQPPPPGPGAETKEVVKVGLIGGTVTKAQGQQQPPQGEKPPPIPTRTLMPTPTQILAGALGLIAIIIVYRTGLICRGKKVHRVV
ncbi:MAG: hypothetical protein QMC80_01070 [Thermoplasmatales archaeon]|nr:hypothetical protein [Thermoplasmatales archaeon]